MKPFFRHAAPSVTMSLDRQAKCLSAEGKDIINLTAGQVDLPMPKAGKKAIAAALQEDRTGYVPADGSADVQEAVRRKIGRTDGRVLISAGAKPLLSAALACICGPGDDVLLPVPCYTSYPEIIRLSGASPVCVPCYAENGFCVLPDDLEHCATPRTKAMLFNHPTNPTGAVYPKAALREIVDFCIAHDLWLIADEVYSTFVYKGEFTGLSCFPEVYDRLILVNSTSKTYAMAGLRLGYAIAPDAAANAIAAYLSHTLGCPCSLSERAAIAVLSSDDTYAAHLREIFRARRDRMLAGLRTIPHLQVVGSDGAFYLWVDIRAAQADDVLFCKRLLFETGVALTPGSAFLAPGFVRIAYTASADRLSDAIDRLSVFMRN